MGWLFQKSWRRENAYKQATNLAGKYRELQIWNVSPEEQVQQEAFSFALPSYVAPSKTRNTNLLMQTSDTAIKHLFYTHTHMHTCARAHTPYLIYPFQPRYCVRIYLFFQPWAHPHSFDRHCYLHCKELKGTRDNVTCFPGKTAVPPSTSTKYRLIKDLQALNNRKHYADFGSV